MIAGATANTPAAKKIGFDKEVYNDYLKKHNGSFDFQDIQGEKNEQGAWSLYSL